MSDDIHRFVQVDFHRFKAFKRFKLHIRHFNILVGPNNAGKSTILAAFRVLAVALRRATYRKPGLVRGPHGQTLGYVIDISSASVAEENIFHDYDDSEPALVRFTLSSGDSLNLYFPETEACILIAESNEGQPKSPSKFQRQFNCPIGFVPILGPVDHNEQLYQEEAARRALYNYTAARNFRNIWYHYPNPFEQFRLLLRETWPGMDIERPTVDSSHEKSLLRMFCPEERIPRELFWSGFGFQVWCQMLTHIVQSGDKALFLIDEPDIYLHADLQRQLLGILRNLGPDVVIATHSTEMISEAEADDIVLVNKKRRSARRIRHPSDLTEVFGALGSNLNPLLTEIAKTRRVVFVEGEDFQIIGKFAKKLGCTAVSNRSNFAVVPVRAFSPERIRSLKTGMESTLGGKVAAAVLLDRDYRSTEECEALVSSCKEFCDEVWFHNCKEIENLLLSPTAIDRAAERRLADSIRRGGTKHEFIPCAQEILDSFAEDKRNYVVAQRLSATRRYAKGVSPETDETILAERTLTEFESKWSDSTAKLSLIPGKNAIASTNQALQERYGISVTPTAIIDAMSTVEVPRQVKCLVANLDAFGKIRPGSKTAAQKRAK